MNWGTHKEPNLKSLHLNSSLPSSKACSIISLLRSWLPNSIGIGCWPDNGTKRRVMTACLHLLLCRTSASVDTSPAREKQGPSLAAPGKKKLYRRDPKLQKQSTMMLKTWLNFHGRPVEAPTASSSDIERPTRNSVLELYGTPHTTTTTGMTCLWFIATRVTRVNNMWTRTWSTLPQMLKNGI